MFTANDLFTINKLFIEKKWDINSDLFIRFCVLYEKLNDREKKLFIELSYDFLYFSLSEYLDGIEEALSKFFIEEKLYNITEIYVSPLLNLQSYYSEDKSIYTKSSHIMTYLFQATELMYNTYLKNKKINVIDNGNKIPKSKINNSSKKMIFLVDDFIGSGELADSALDYFINTCGLLPSKIRVISLVTHTESLNIFKKHNVKIYSCKFVKKGISDKYSGIALNNKLQTMKNIEKKLNILGNDSLGYNSCEALVKMIRTPNNTFPIYYKTTEKNIAPFPRGW